MYLNLIQKINDILYKILGASNIVIEMQIFINKKRCDKDKVDKNEILLYDDEQPIVQ